MLDGTLNRILSDPVGDLTTRNRLTGMSLVTATVAAGAVDEGRLTSLEDLIAVEGEETGNNHLYAFQPLFLALLTSQFWV